jgi:protein-tyrosine phosphatase
VVHCQMGISRSATVIIAYLMKRFKWSYGMARDYLRECRPSIYPNSGFVRQLKEWGREIGVKCLKRRRRE